MIRDATTADLGALLMMVEAMHGESRFRRRRLSLDKMAALFSALIASDDGLVLVAEHDGQVIGAFAGYVTEDWFGPDRIAGDFGLFVKPDRRGGLTAAGLIQRYVEWARSRGVDHPEVGISTGIRTEATAKLYESLGFSRVGPILSYMEP